jgi:hypothetical protein
MHTGSRAFCFLMALAATGAETASTSAATTTCSSPGVQPGHYRVEAKIISVSAKASKDIDAGYLSREKLINLIQRPGASVLSCPLVDSSQATSAHIDVTRDVALPHGSTRTVGINLDVVPQKHGPDSGYQVSIKDVRFQGFRDAAATDPIFHIGRVTTSVPFTAQPDTGYYCIDVPAPKKVATTYDADGRRSAAIADANERELLFVKISRG